MGPLPPELREERREDDEEGGPVVTRCELPEGKPLPLSWTYHNPMQMPLLPPEDLAVYKRCLQVFCMQRPCRDRQSVSATGTVCEQ